jgi:hypothetical protein
MDRGLASGQALGWVDGMYNSTTNDATVGRLQLYSSFYRVLVQNTE